MDLNDPAFVAARQGRERNGAFRGELWFRRRDGSRFTVEISSALYQKEGQQELVSVTFRDISQRKQHEHELESSREQIRRLWAFVQSVREAEQKRLARELHDELGQLITAMKLDLGWLRRSLPKGERFLEDKVADLDVLVEASLDAQRRLLAGLRPRVLDEVGLSAACQWLLQELQRSSGLTYQLCVSHAEFILSDELATAIFRIVQEALTNVARHAQASHVRVSLVQDEQILTVRIADDGRGFAPGQLDKSLSFGLLGIRERAHLLGGELSINSAPSQGAAIEIALPLTTALGGASLAPV